MRFLHAYNHPHKFESIFSAEELDEQARALYPGPWLGCPFDEKAKRVAEKESLDALDGCATPLKTLREELSKPRSSGWKEKGGICRWIPTEEFTLDKRRPWIDEQNREIRWLCAETEDKGVPLTDRDLHCMFPTRSLKSTRDAIRAYRDSDEVFPEPTKLAWLSQALLDGDAADSGPGYASLRP